MLHCFDQAPVFAVDLLGLMLRFSMLYNRTFHMVISFGYHRKHRDASVSGMLNLIANRPSLGILPRRREKNIFLAKNGFW